MRVTAQRIALFRVIGETEDYPEVEDLHRRAQVNDPNISIATVYRTVCVLERAGMIQRHSFKGARARYERVDKVHHNHIVDLETDEIVEFQSDRIEQLQSEIAALMGFDMIHHRLELYCCKRPKTP